MIIIGITGTIGAGKGAIVDYLTNKKKFVHYSVRDFITKEISKRNLNVNRDTMVSVANDLRAKHSPAYIVEQLYEGAKTAGKNCIIESIRTPGEATLLQSKGNFFLFAVDALPENRYRRIKLRASETDFVSYETFLENEKREMNSDDPNKQNLKKCIEMADYFFENNGSVADLYEKIKVVLEKINNHD